MDVFISYHHDDSDFARLLRAELSARGVHAWLAAINLRPGDCWSEEIDQAIEATAAMIIVMSSHSRSSEYVTYEWAYAMGMQKPVIPVLHDPAAKQHPKLDGLHYLDFTRKGAEPWESLFAAVDEAGQAARDPATRMLYKQNEVRRMHEALTTPVSPAPVPPKGEKPSADVHDVLVVVDVQKDFFPSGALAAPDAESLLGPLNKAISAARDRQLGLVFTRDWHPADHSSFSTFGGEWPPHCCQGTAGAEFHDALIVPPKVPVINIGAEPARFGYTPYEDEEMDRLLNRRDVGTVYVAGIALEYCVQATCLDTRRRGKRVVLCSRLVRAATKDPVRIAQIHHNLKLEGVEVSDELVPFE